MPTYEYLCDACDHRFEEFQWMSEDPLKVCPKCGKKKLRRLIGAGLTPIFKGEGFYETDYRSESYKAAAKAEQDASSGTKSADSKGDTNGKPRAKGETKAKSDKK